MFKTRIDALLTYCKSVLNIGQLNDWFIVSSTIFTGVARYWVNGYRIRGNDWGVLDKSLRRIPLAFWRKGEPNNVGNIENCVENIVLAKHSHHLGWNDIKCDNKLHFICKTSPRS